MTTSHDSFVTLEMSRHDAKELLALVKDASGEKYDKDSDLFVGMSKSTKDRICKELRDGLKPWYTYTVKCSDCSRTWEHRTQTKLKGKEPIQGGYCAECSDDYK